MARTKEFDPGRALHRAISVFSQKGFAAASTEELMGAMQLGRQSMYDTFGDKRALFLRASKSTSRKAFEPLMSNFELQGHRLLPSGAHWFIFQNAKIFPVPMGAWGLVRSVNSGCEMKR